MKSMSPLLVLFFSLSLCVGASAKVAGYNAKDGVFLSGYDPVSYHLDQKASKGKAEFSSRYKGLTIYFSSEKNKKAFQENPEKMLPAYNGWCAYALAQGGGLVEVNPERFKVIHGKTYLFFDDRVFLRGRVNTLDKWNKSEDAPQVKAADDNWTKNHSS